VRWLQYHVSGRGQVHRAPTVRESQGAPIVKDPPKRRIFLEEGGRGFQIFSVAQETDGSIYISSPGFEKSVWLELSSPDAKAGPAPGVGKLSIHASGLAGVREHASREGHKFTVEGTPLIHAAKEDVHVHSARHLTTVFPSKPSHAPLSPAGNRTSDYVLSATTAKPRAFIFFAVPRATGLKQLKLEMVFHEDVGGVPPDFSWGEITLPLHLLAWIAYSTKQMTQWPATYHYCFHDGYLVPFFMGGGPTHWTFCGVNPVYGIVGSELTISLNASAFDGKGLLPD